MQNEISTFISYAEMHPLLCKEREIRLICDLHLYVLPLLHLHHECPCLHHCCECPCLRLHCYGFRYLYWSWCVSRCCCCHEKAGLEQLWSCCEWHH